MGNYASVGDSYTKGESDIRYPLKTVVDAAIENSNSGLAARYTKTESDNLFQPKGNYLKQSDISNLPSIDNVYTKTDSDTTFLKKVDAANLYQPIGGELASITFVNNKFSDLEKSIKTDIINLGEYSLTNTNSQLCLTKKNETQSFCFDGKIVIKK